ncbi:MAG TPA: OmpA family protein [Caulobacteraceae bacterium]|jgi:outer membrane protein OmpA-like peptidoglycan-associated protein
MAVRTKWAVCALGLAAVVALEGCAQMQGARSRVAGMVARQPCENVSTTFYFESGSDQLSDPAKQVVAETAKMVGNCQVGELQLVGLADPAGAPAANVELSNRRAQAVLDAFVAQGVNIPRFNIVAAGERGATGASGVVEPIRRRVEATLVVGRQRS